MNAYGDLDNIQNLVTQIVARDLDALKADEELMEHYKEACSARARNLTYETLR